VPFAYQKALHCSTVLRDSNNLTRKLLIEVAVTSLDVPLPALFFSAGY